MYNKYDIIIVILIVSLAAGNIGGAFQIVRILSILFLPLLLKRIEFCQFYIRKYQFFFASFIFYSCCSLGWSLDIEAGIKEITYIICHTILFFEVLVFSRYARNINNSIPLGWFLAILSTLGIAFWELVSDDHLALSIHGSDLIYRNGEIFQRRYASVTFGNLNGYVTFLCFALPFLFYKISYVKKITLTDILYIVVLLLSVVCILYNSSRGGLLSVLVMAIIFFVFQKKNKYTIFYIFVLFILGGYIFSEFGDSMLNVISQRADEDRLFEDDSRITTWTNVLVSVSETMGFGVGVGSAEASLSQYKHRIHAPHNMILEILLRYGFVFTIIFLLFLCNMFFKAIKSKNKKIKLFICIVLFSMPFYSVVNSMYLLSPYVYIFYACLIVFLDYEYIKKCNRPICKVIQ